MDYGTYQKEQGEKFMKWLKSGPTKLTGWVLLLAIIGSVFIGLMNHYFISREIGDWQYRAQISSNVVDMKSDMEKVKAGLEKWQMTEGNAYLIFKRPETDMGLVMQAVNSILFRAGQLESLNITSTEYQVGMDDLRGVIRELWIPAGLYWTRHHGLVWFIVVIVLYVLSAGLLIRSIFKSRQ